MVIGLATGAVLAGLGTVAWALAGVGEFLAFFGLWGGLTAGVALVLARLLRRRPDGGDDDGPGGGGPDSPRDDGPGGGGMRLPLGWASQGSRTRDHRTKRSRGPRRGSEPLPRPSPARVRQPASPQPAHRRGV